MRINSWDTPQGLVFYNLDNTVGVPYFILTYSINSEQVAKGYSIDSCNLAETAIDKRFMDNEHNVCQTRRRSNRLRKPHAGNQRLMFCNYANFNDSHVLENPMGERQLTPFNINIRYIKLRESYEDHAQHLHIRYFNR